jgi:hypothetical protein
MALLQTGIGPECASKRWIQGDCGGLQQGKSRPASVGGASRKREWARTEGSSGGDPDFGEPGSLQHSSSRD